VYYMSSPVGSDATGSETGNRFQVIEIFNRYIIYKHFVNEFE